MATTIYILKKVHKVDFDSSDWVENLSAWRTLEEAETEKERIQKEDEIYHNKYCTQRLEQLLKKNNEDIDEYDLDEMRSIVGKEEELYVIEPIPFN